jgi:predicted nucleic acid-binding protein
MEWLSQLQGQLVGLDTAPLIYFVEENPNYIGMMDAFFAALHHQNFSAVTSAITVTEVLVHPLRSKNEAIVQQYRDILLNSDELTVMDVTRTIAEVAARLRASRNLRTPDAIQLATALDAGATFFLTNDAGFPAIPELQVLVLDNLRN